jgi:ArsR family transcriptional regulator
MNTLISKVDILKAIAHPARISILEELTKGVKCVSDLKQFLDISQPNISQHLTALRHAGLVDYFVDGRLKCYFLKNPIIPDLLEIIKKDYPEDLPRPECCPVTKKGKYPGKRKN